MYRPSKHVMSNAETAPQLPGSSTTSSHLPAGPELAPVHLSSGDTHCLSPTLCGSQPRRVPSPAPPSPLAGRQAHIFVPSETGSTAQRREGTDASQQAGQGPKLRQSPAPNSPTGPGQQDSSPLTPDTCAFSSEDIVGRSWVEGLLSSHFGPRDAQVPQ